MNKYLANILPWLLVLVVLHIIFFQNRKSDAGCEYRDTVRDTVVVTVWDTVRVTNPEEVRSEELGVRNYRVKRAERAETSKSTETTTDEADKANKADSADVELPITQKVYEDSTYRAWVSGYDARLDSIMVYRPIHYVTVVKEPASRFSWGLQMGVGMTPKGLQPYIGIGGQLRF